MLYNRNATRHWTLEQEENQLNAIQQRVNRRDILVNMKTIHDENRPLFKRTNMVFFFVSLLSFFALKGEKNFCNFEICETVSKYALHENTFPSVHQR